MSELVRELDAEAVTDHEQGSQSRVGQHANASVFGHDELAAIRNRQYEAALAERGSAA